MFGGLEERAKYERSRVVDYLEGRAELIDELEWELLPYKQRGESWWYKSPATSISISTK